jgi:hypothetical protein
MASIPMPDDANAKTGWNKQKRKRGGMPPMRKYGPTSKVSPERARADYANYLKSLLSPFLPYFRSLYACFTFHQLPCCVRSEPFENLEHPSLSLSLSLSLSFSPLSLSLFLSLSATSPFLNFMPAGVIYGLMAQPLSLLSGCLPEQIASTSLCLILCRLKH